MPLIICKKARVIWSKMGSFVQLGKSCSCELGGYVKIVGGSAKKEYPFNHRYL